MSTEVALTFAERALLLHMEPPARLAWAAVQLRETPPVSIRLGPADRAALEALMAWLQGPMEVIEAFGVGRAVSVVYRPRVLPEGDPSIPIAFPLLEIPAYRRAVSEILLGQLARASWEEMRGRVEKAAELLLRLAPGRLTRPETAFGLLATMHLLADPSGLSLVRRWL